jgi:hypothetical protein
MVTPEHARRTFQIVVAATRQWGIGKGMILALLIAFYTAFVRSMRR